MAETTITLDDFERALMCLFKQPLNKKAEVAAKDFWQNIPAIYEGVLQGNININVDVLMLARSFPEYRTYHAWKGLAIFMFIMALPTLLTSWKFAFGLYVAGIIFHIIGNMKRKKAGKRFVTDIHTAIAAGDLHQGIARLCTLYIAGIVQLSTSIGQAHWPQLPSDCLTGKKNLIQ